MRAIVQRVTSASVQIENKEKASIERGFLVLLGVTHEDRVEDADYLIKKIVGLRVFSDEQGKMNLSLSQVSGEILLVSQFTLYADTSRGNRPSFIQAAGGEQGEYYYEYVKRALGSLNVPFQCGEFGADMQVNLVNDGPVTIIIDSKNR